MVGHTNKGDLEPGCIYLSSFEAPVQGPISRHLPSPENFSQTETMFLVLEIEAVPATQRTFAEILTLSTTHAYLKPGPWRIEKGSLLWRYAKLWVRGDEL
mgnify:CR=1